MIFKYAIFFLFCAVPVLLKAEAASAESQLRSLLKEHQSKIPFKVKFAQIKTVQEIGLELPSSGELEVKKAGFAIWKMLKPAFMSVEISPSEIKVFNTLGGAPRIIKKENEKEGDLQGNDWMKLLMEEPEKIAKAFEVSQVAPLRFKLVPKIKNQGFEWLEFAFGKAAVLQEVFIQENKEDSLKIKFSPLKKGN